MEKGVRGKGEKENGRERCKIFKILKFKFRVGRFFLLRKEGINIIFKKFSPSPSHTVQGHGAKL